MLMRFTRRLFPITLALAAAALAGPAPAAAVTISVTECTDTTPTGAPGELRAAILAAVDGDEVVIDRACPVITLTGTPGEDAGLTGDLDVNANITIRGAGAGRTTIDGGGLDRVFDIPAGRTVTIQGLTIRNGAPGAAAGGGIFLSGTLTLTDVELRGNQATQGGGIFVDPTGALTLNRVTIAGNTTTDDGGGIYVNGTATGSNVTISGNSAATDGGGLLTNASGTVTLTNATVANNTATNLGGGLRNFGTVGLSNTILATNTATGGNPDCDSAAGLTSTTHNFIGDLSGCTVTPGSGGDIAPGTPPGLGPLAQNGGGARTQALQTGSPAIDAGDNAACPATDERREPRPARGSAIGTATCDIGAFEVVIPAVNLALVLNQGSYAPGDTLLATIQFSNPGDALVGDALLGILVPASASPGLGCLNGQAIAFVTQTAPLIADIRCVTDSPATFQELLKDVTIPPVPSPITVPNFFSLTFPPGTPPGVFTMFIAVTLPEGLADGSLDANDIVAAGVANFTVTP